MPLTASPQATVEAVAGEHQVSITALPIPDGQKPAQPPVAAKYADFTTSGLTTTVTPETKEIVLTINRRGSSSSGARTAGQPLGQGTWKCSR